MYVYVALIGLSRANNFEEFGSTYRGIVKDLIQLKYLDLTGPGLGHFSFSSRYYSAYNEYYFCTVQCCSNSIPTKYQNTFCLSHSISYQGMFYKFIFPLFLWAHIQSFWQDNLTISLLGITTYAVLQKIACQLYAYWTDWNMLQGGLWKH